MREVRILTSFCTSRINIGGACLRGDMVRACEAIWCVPVRRYGCAPAVRYGYMPAVQRGLHALSDLLGFRDASLEFGDALGVAWVGAEEVAAA